MIWMMVRSQSFKIIFSFIVGFQLSLLLLVVFWINPVIWVENEGLTNYFHNGQSLMAGQLPYRDFSLEYPPLSLIPTTIPFLFGLQNINNYGIYFGLVNIFLSIVLTMMIGWVSSKREQLWSQLSPPLYFSSLIVLLSPIALRRFDLFPTVLAFSACLLLYKQKNFLAGFFLGLGFAAKLFPILLLPVFLIYLFFQSLDKKRAIINLISGTSLATLVSFVPFLFFGPASISSFLQYHVVRGIQIESLYAGLVMLIAHFNALPLGLNFTYGSFNLTFPFDQIVATFSTLLFVIVFALYGLYLKAKFKKIDLQQENLFEQFLFACLSILIIFIITNKVFSPQFLIWLLPFLAFVPGYLFYLVVLLFLTTIKIYPFLYGDLLAFQWPAVLMLNLRNFLLLICLVLVGRLKTTKKRQTKEC